MANKIPPREFFGDIPHAVYEYFRNLGVDVQTQDDDETASNLIVGLVAALSSRIESSENEKTTSELLLGKIQSLENKINEIENNDYPLFASSEGGSMEVIARGFKVMASNATTTEVISIPNLTDYIIVQSCASGMSSKINTGSNSFYAAVAFTGSAELTNETTITFRTNNIAPTGGSGTTTETSARIDWALVRIA